MIRNRQLLISGVFLTDVAAALREKGLPATSENILAYAVEIQGIASASAKAMLQDASPEECLDAISLFRDRSDQINDNPAIDPGTWIGQGERMRPVPVTIQTEE